ncbi:nucleoside diphosphate kinase regulator [Sphingomonas sp.]|jgi:regulator of nucleoside diphosphate kinase|uniref:nucleoside diphosphate kinase regulator n=1 Tax=Sphingomonas sp. TaxID=28214 RepID=UPI002DB707E0|nr:nucleoside diphosphate kinase regulator [Sphingomonas sp.]HEU4968072.1 nucleoside diphosphate kinase regulator [Sphingomonas sp.]
MKTTNVTRRVARPPVHLIDSECDRLVDLALQAEGRNPAVAAMLLGEIERAETHRAEALPPGTVTIGSEVDFLDEGTHRLRTVTLVMPGEADIEAGRVSVLTPVGAGLIGLREGQAIDWPDRDGTPHRLRILAVRRPD